MEKGPLVSIVVPVYNVKLYLVQCVDSIRSQTLSNIEILLIDDGSTDGSSEICDSFKNDPRISVIHKKNEGLSAARNLGIEMANAEYIMFVDADDWVSPMFCEVPYQIAENKHVDIVCFQHVRVGKNGRMKKTGSFPREGIVDKEDAVTQKSIGVSAWNKLYRRSVFLNVKYPRGRVCEDNATTHRLIHVANGVYLLNKELYFHRMWRKGSISSTKSVNTKKDYVWARTLRISDFEEWGIAYEDERLCAALNIIATIGCDLEDADWCISALKNAKKFPKQANYRQRIMFRVYKISPKLFDLICIIMNKRL